MTRRRMAGELIRGTHRPGKNGCSESGKGLCNQEVRLANEAAQAARVEAHRIRVQKELRRLARKGYV